MTDLRSRKHLNRVLTVISEAADAWPHGSQQRFYLDKAYSAVVTARSRGSKPMGGGTCRMCRQVMTIQHVRAGNADCPNCQDSRAGGTVERCVFQCRSGHVEAKYLPVGAGTMIEMCCPDCGADMPLIKRKAPVTYE